MVQYAFGNYQVPRGIRQPIFSNLGFLSPIQNEYFQQTPEAVMGGYMQALRQQQSPRSFQSYAEKWLPRAYQDYQYTQAMNPTNEETFMNYLNNQGNVIQNDYMRSLSTRPPIRQTRLLWSR